MLPCGVYRRSRYAAGWSRRMLSSDVGPRDRYAALVKSGGLRYDQCQVPVLIALDGLDQVIANYEAADLDSDEKPRVPRGVYVHGEVGTGKSLLMDLFFESACVAKRRVHFHEFMLDVHRRVHAGETIAGVGRSIAEDTPLVCFDEMQVTDVADAMILRRLFHALWRRGGVVVATSNRAPWDLYENGVNRRYFVPFVHQLETHCRVLRLESTRDHRHEFTAASDRLVWEAVDDAWLDTALETALGGRPSWMSNVKIDVGCRRSLTVPRVAVARRRRAAVFDFDALCDADVGAADYAALASAFDVVAVLDVPKLPLKRHDVARRFITLIDCLYEARIQLVLQAHSPPDHLFPSQAAFLRDLEDATTIAGLDRPHGPTDPASTNDDDDAASLELTSVRELAWAFRRAASRLVEMAAVEWPSSASVARHA